VRNGREIRFATPGKVGGFPMEEGDTIVLQAAGGGGYGDPLERPIDEVAADIREGYVTAAHARAVYGVALGSDGEVDTPVSDALRRDIAGRRIRLRVTASAEPLYEAGRYSRHRIC